MAERTWVGDRGSVTAEFAALVPAVLLVLAFGMGALEVVVQQVRVTDAAADAARSVARGDGTGPAHARVTASVGIASLSMNESGDFVCVTVGQRAAGPLALTGLDVSGKGCALREDAVGTAPS